MLMSLRVVSFHHGESPALLLNEDTLPKALGSPAGPAIGSPQDFLHSAWEWHWRPGQGRGRNDLQMLDLLLGLGQVQLSPCECAVQAALLCVQPQCVLTALKLLSLHLGRNMERRGSCRII